MPFDGLSIRPNSLAETLGIQPVDRTVLDEHKIAQRKRYPASWTYRHRDGIRAALVFWMVSCLAAVAVGAISIVAAICLGKPIYALVGVAIIVGATVFTWLIENYAHNIKLRRPATWREEVLPFSAYRQIVMPPSVKALMEHIALTHRNADLRIAYGELRQETELLDPYIVVHSVRTGGQCVVAIWDGDTVLHCATII